MNKKITVFYLARNLNGLKPFLDFLETYKGNDAGIDHDLIIIYKGFADSSEIEDYEFQLQDIPHGYIHVDDEGFDLGAYFKASLTTDSESLCFLNSFSLILSKNWLLKMSIQLAPFNVGMVGATGSAGTIRPRFRVGLRTSSPKTLLELLRKILWYPFQITLFMFLFPRFPNYHIRTNGFMIKKDVMYRLRKSKIHNKVQAYTMESGKFNLTKQVEKMGLECLVVDKNGVGYKKGEWQSSNTFWSGNQENLLIADNQTEKYRLASYQNRMFLIRFAWGGS